MSLLTSFFLILFLPSTSFGYTCSRANSNANNCSDLVKLNSSAAQGKCLPDETPHDVSALLKRNNVETFTGKIPIDRGQKEKPAKNLKPFSDLSDPRVIALAKVLSAFEKIGNGALSSALNSGETIKVVFQNDEPGQSGNSRRHGNQIQLIESGENSTGLEKPSETKNSNANIALLSHELAHFIGSQKNNQGLRNFDAYLKTVQPKCRLTTYAGRKRGEEFAEVLAAYITLPEIFQNKGRGCRKAFNFMKNLVGEPNMTMSCEARKQSYSLKPYDDAVLRSVRRRQQRRKELQERLRRYNSRSPRPDGLDAYGGSVN